jgi:hypothetical protein
MEPGAITADVTAILVRGLSIWLSAIFVLLCGAGVAVYACLLWQVCAPGRQMPVRQRRARLMSKEGVTIS